MLSGLPEVLNFFQVLRPFCTKVTKLSTGTRGNLGASSHLANRMQNRNFRLMFFSSVDAQACTLHRVLPKCIKFTLGSSTATLRRPHRWHVGSANSQAAFALTKRSTRGQPQQSAAALQPSHRTVESALVDSTVRIDGAETLQSLSPPKSPRKQEALFAKFGGKQSRKREQKRESLEFLIHLKVLRELKLFKITQLSQLYCVGARRPLSLEEAVLRH